MHSRESCVENVLLVVIDALRYDRVDRGDGTDNLMPNLKKLAQTGERFDSAYACINATDPSMTTIMTGQYPRRHGLINHGEQVTEQELRYLGGTEMLPERLSETHTTIAGDHLERWHTRGFDEYLNPATLHRGIKETLAPLVERVPSPIRSSLYTAYNSLLDDGSPQPPILGDDLTDEMLTALNGTDEPWFAMVHYWDTHFPYTRVTDYPAVVEERVYPGDDEPIRDQIASIRGSDWWEKLEPYFLDRVETIGDAHRLYDAATWFVDQQLGRLIDALERANMREETAIIVTSDHGESLTEHGVFFDHHGLYDESIHVPLVVEAPGFDGEEDGFVQHVDIAPTVLSLLDMEHEPEAFDGRPLKPSDERNLSDRSAVYAEEAYVSRRRAIRTEKYKFIQRIGDHSHCRYCDITHMADRVLHDLTENPDESRNVIGERAGAAADLEEQLDRWIAELPSPSPSDYTSAPAEQVERRLEDMGYL